MIFAAILVYFAKEHLIRGEGMAGFAGLAIVELSMEIALIGAVIAH